MLKFVKTFISDMFCSPKVRKLRRWVRRTDLKGSDYIVVRSYVDYNAFIELRWIVYEKDKEHHIFLYEKRCKLKHTGIVIDAMENGRLLSKIHEKQQSIVFE